MPRRAMPGLPKLLERKLYKTGQTRGADDDDIIQNRVLRTSTVLIPYNQWDKCSTPPEGASYVNGYIVLIHPADYFGKPPAIERLAAQGLAIGQNALVFYEQRSDWNAYNPDALGWKPATRRIGKLGGQYAARVPATTGAEGGKINRGFNQTKMKGAGIWVYEYAREETILSCRLQLEALFWLCRNANEVIIANGMAPEEAAKRKVTKLEDCVQQGLLDLSRLKQARVISTGDFVLVQPDLEELPR